MNDESATGWRSANDDDSTSLVEFYVLEENLLEQSGRRRFPDPGLWSAIRQERIPVVVTSDTYLSGDSAEGVVCPVAPRH